MSGEVGGTGVITPEWFRIAAGMIDAKKFSITGLATADEVQAAAFLFDQGIFYLGESGMQEVKTLLLQKYNDAPLFDSAIEAARSK